MKRDKKKKKTVAFEQPEGFSKNSGRELTDLDKLDFGKLDSTEIINATDLGMEYSFYGRTIPSKLFTKVAGALHIISKHYESLDYDEIENDLLIDEEVEKGHKMVVRKNFIKWLTFLLIGFFTAVVASSVDMTINYFSKLKFEALVRALRKYEYEKTYIIPLQWMGLNLLPFFIGAMLVTYVEPCASGSGIPLIKCYLNGIYIPKMLSFKTLVVKAIGLVCTITGGVASGKEGPMIHIGGAVASIISKGSFGGCLKRLSYRYFREDKERRDLVSAGAACGVSAAFGASVGGVLFSLEEGASFWNQTLTWRIFFASAASKFFVNLILSAYHGHLGDLVHPSLVNLGKCNFDFAIYEIPVFMMVGCLGGLTGSFWNYLNYKIAIFRISFVRAKWLRVLEASFVAVFTALVAFLMTYTTADCSPKVNNTLNTADISINVFCSHYKEPRYNVVASMWLRTPQHSVNTLIHDPVNTYSLVSLATFALAYYVLSCITFGLSTSNGIFVPALLTGAAWGRLLATCVIRFIKLTFDSTTYAYAETILTPGKYALIAAIAQLGGIVRMTLSLTVIVMETSDNISFSLPIVLTLICAKWTGEFFTDPFYDILIKLKQAPFLYWDPPPLTHNIYATELMNRPVVCVRVEESVRYIVQLLSDVTHNGFPIVESAQPNIDDNEDHDRDRSARTGRLKGLILRSQIMIMLRKRYFEENEDLWINTVNLDVFREGHLHHDSIDDLKLSYTELNMHINFKKFMNCSPYTLMINSSLPQIFRLFRALGLRHVPIVNYANEVQGMITRKDLAKYRHSRHRGKVYLELATIE